MTRAWEAVDPEVDGKNKEKGVGELRVTTAGRA